jgi:hypothetical protein
MNIRKKSTLVLLLLAILDLISVFFPITALLGIYVVWKRPEWFLKLVNEIYYMNQS